MRSGPRRLALLSAVGLLAIVFPAAPASAAPFTVNSNADDDDGTCEGGPGDCTLREAINAANVDGTEDTIGFNITPDTITVTTVLPTVSQPAIIDGTSDPDSNRIRLVPDGALPSGTDGLTINAPGGTVKGLEIDGFAGAGADGIRATVSGDATITIGGTGSFEGNVLSGNGGAGVNGTGLDGTYVLLGNIVGLRVDGTTVDGNGDGGVVVQGDSSNVGGTTGTTPGGPCTGACNLISGNTGIGATFGGNDPMNPPTFQGNYVGTDVTGLLDRGNTASGVFQLASPATTETIGGAAPAARNIISGNDGAGLSFSDVNSSNSITLGNYIGVGADGVTPLGNDGDGVSIGGDDNEIGGTGPGEGNVIANNLGVGIRVFKTSSGDMNTVRNSIRGNAIFANGNSPNELGIDLTPPFGVSQNDPGDVDDQTDTANFGQNFPVVTSAGAFGGAAIVEGTLNSTTSTTFDVDLYASDACNAAPTNDFGEGERYLGSTTVLTDGSGDGSFIFISSGTPPVVAGEVITTTATDPDGNTSEFSHCETVSSFPGVAVGDAAVTEGDSGPTSASFTVTRTGPLSMPSSVQYATADGTATAPSDYQATSGTVNFGPAEDTAIIEVPVVGDSVSEPDETFTVTLSNPTGAGISKAQGAGTITDDDSCRGFQGDPRAQLPGTPGPDHLVGTGAAEILCGLDGNDVLKGGGGKDLVLGGNGNDTLAGQGGKDTLKGQKGKDRLSGGPGADRCAGGPGRDAAVGCEKGKA